MAATNLLTSDELVATALDPLPGGPLVVALGGGADSSVAAWLAAHRSRTRAVFVRHGLAGSTDLEAAARSVADRLGIRIAYLDGPIEPGSSMEDRARRVRWAAIGRDVRENETVVTGHTRDDQAETVLMNLLRGSGNAGLAGMLRSRPGVARPLLGFARSDIRSVAVELGLPFADDPANEDRRNLRSRVRSELLPMLDRDYRPQVRSILARVGSLAAADDRMIESVADEVPVTSDEEAIVIPSAALVTMPRPIASRAVRRALRHLLEPYAGSTADVEAVMAVAEARSEAATIKDGVMVTREGPYVAISPGRRSLPEPVPLAVPSTIVFGAARIGVTRAVAPAIRRRSTLLADPAILDDDPVVRCAVDGDRIDIESGSKSVRAVLAERDIPVRRRITWPVLSAGGRIAVVAGIRVASWARPEAGEALVITTERGSS